MLTQNFERIIRRKKEKDEEGILAVGEKEAQDKQKEELLLKKREEIIKEIKDKVKFDEIDSAEKIFQMKMEEKSKLKMAQASASPPPPSKGKESAKETMEFVRLLEEAEKKWDRGGYKGSAYRDFLFENRIKCIGESNNEILELINKKIQDFYEKNANAISETDLMLADKLKSADFSDAKSGLEKLKLKYDFNAEVVDYIEQAELVILEIEQDVEKHSMVGKEKDEESASGAGEGSGEKENLFEEKEQIVTEKERVDLENEQEVNNLKRDISELNKEVRKNVIIDKYGKDFAFNREKTYQSDEGKKNEEGYRESLKKDKTGDDRINDEGGKNKNAEVDDKVNPIIKIKRGEIIDPDKKDYPLAEIAKDEDNDEEAEIISILKNETKLLEYHKSLDDFIREIKANEDSLAGIIIRKEFNEKINDQELKDEKMAAVEKEEQEIKERDVKLKEEAEMCFINELKKGGDIEEMKNNLKEEGKKDLVRILETVENRLKFMSPDRVRENFGKELEYLAVNSEEKIFSKANKDSREYRDLLKMAEILGFADEVEKEKSKLDNLLRKGSEKSMTKEEIIKKKVCELKEKATEWTKMDIYFKKQQAEMAATKSPQAKGKGEDSVWNKVKDNIKTFGEFTGGLAKVMVAFKGTAWLMTAAGATGGLAAGGTFLATALAMTGMKEWQASNLKKKDIKKAENEQ